MPLAGERNRPDADVKEWIERTQARKLTPADIPSPLGRSQAGWGDLRVKVQPEVHTMIEQLMEHPALRGKFETKSQVGWMLIHLGTAAVYRYLQDNWADHDDIIDSITYRLATLQRERARIQLREAMMEVCDTAKANATDYLAWGTAEGKYRAYKVIKAAYDTRINAPNVERFNAEMSGMNPLKRNMEHAAVERYYDQMMRGLGEDVYLELTQEFYDELDHEERE